MCRIQKFLSLSLALAFFSAAVASDWPNFRGSQYDGFSDEKLPNKDWKTKPPKELWRIPMGDNGYAGPSVATGKLFIIDHKDARDVVRALDVKSGQKVWNYDYDDTDKEQGYGFAHSTPTYDAGRVYTLSALGMLHCLKADDGTLVWKCDIKAKYGGHWRGTNWGYAGSPLIDGDKLIVCPGGIGASVVALDKNTGNEIWKGGGDDPPGYGTPVKATIGDKPQYVIFSGLAAMGVDADKGTKLWSLPWRTDYDVNAATPVVVGNTVFVTSDYGKGCALLDAAAVPAAEVWKNKALKSHFNTPIVFEGHLYGIGKPGELCCIVQATGDVKWKAPGFQDGGLMGIDGTLIAVNGSDGDVVLCKLSPEKYDELGRIKPLSGRSWTAPIVSGGKLFIRNQTTLVCLDLNPAK